MRLTDLPRTTSFRLALLFLVLFATASLGMFAFLFAQTNGYLVRMTDNWLNREQVGFAQLDQPAFLKRLAAHTIADPEAERPFTLFDAAGRRIGGTPLDLATTELAKAPLGQPFEFTLTQDGNHVRYRGLARRTPSGDLLLIAENMADAPGARRGGFTSVDLAQILTDAVEFYEPMAEEKGIILHAGPSAAAMPGDPNLLFEAIGNLVDNAIKFTPAGGRVTARAFAEGGRTSVEVMDTGPGIPQGERESVSQRFYRAEKSRNTPGTGLGLALVAAVARLHGMELVISDAMPGCRVTLTRSSTPGAYTAMPDPAAEASFVPGSFGYPSNAGAHST